jgi:hypothetical protein
MAADADAPNKPEYKKLLIRTRTMFETWQNERDGKYKFPQIYYDIRNLINQYDRVHGRTKKAPSKSGDGTENTPPTTLPKKVTWSIKQCYYCLPFLRCWQRKISKKVISPEHIEDSDTDASIVIADFNPGNTPLTTVPESNVSTILLILG